jgi:hypothetical protein
MVLEVIATRDIEPDEEIFINYGKFLLGTIIVAQTCMPQMHDSLSLWLIGDLGRDWEDAWKKHAERWQDPCVDVDSSKPCFKSSRVIAGMNRDKFNSSYHAWSEDHVTYCIYHSEGLDPTDIHSVLLTHDGQFTNFASAVETDHQQSYQGISFEDEGFQVSSFRMSSGERVYACEIVNADKGASTFEVLLFINAQKTDSIMRVVHIHNFPSDWLVFRPRPFHGDTTMSSAFRHEIAIPDESFPEFWKDLKRQKVS